MPGRSLSSLILVAVMLPFLKGGELCAQDASPKASQQVREQLQKFREKQQNAEKNVSLRKASIDVTQSRIAELKKMLDEAGQRLTTEQASLTELNAESSKLAAEIQSLEAIAKQHDAADQLEMAAASAEARLGALVAAKQQLDAQLSSLRKSSVEWQSKAVESEQQVQGLEGQREALQKAVTDSETASDAAEQKLVAANTALTAATQARDDLMNQLATEEQRLQGAAASLSKLKDSVVQMEKTLATLRETSAALGVNSEEAAASLTSALTDLQPLLANSEALVVQTTTRRDQMKPMAEAAVAELQKKQAEQTAIADEAARAIDAWKQAVAKVNELNQKQTELRAAIAESQVWQKTLNGQMTGTEPSVQKLAAEIQLVKADAVAQRRLAETAMEPLGRFVSFSRDVAPILAQHCIACHNTRSPGGRLNLDSFAALQKGGENGASFQHMKSTESLMVMMVEDGSMPKDAEPLSAEEIATLKKWIDVGAPLDAGILATAELFDVMPEASQPLPPKTYRVPIPVTATAFSPDGTVLATSGYHEVLVWNTADGSLIRRITNVAERVYDVEFTPDGQSLVVAAGTPGQLGEAKKFSTADGSLVQTLVRSKDSIFALSLSPDGTLLATAGADRSINVVRVADGASQVRIEDHADWVMDVNWSPDGTKLVSSSRDKTSKVFDSKSGDPQITFAGHGEPVYSAAFLSDSKTVVSGGSDKRLHIWTIADAKEVRAIGGFGSDVFRVVVIAGDNILSACADRNAREHKSSDGSVVRTLSGHADWVYTLAVNTQKNLIATGSYDGEIRLWNSADGSMATSFIGIPKDAGSADNVTAQSR
ncbi:MAG: hypothetical protein JNL58_17960 [Planctomyces sp.]|nr:hypothetical protein [Planctomyces sp.]